MSSLWFCSIKATTVLLTFLMIACGYAVLYNPRCHTKCAVFSMGQRWVHQRPLCICLRGIASDPASGNADSRQAALKASFHFWSNAKAASFRQRGHISACVLSIYSYWGLATLLHACRCHTALQLPISASREAPPRVHRHGCMKIHQRSCKISHISKWELHSLVPGYLS